MMTLTLDAEVTADGMLRLEAPIGLPAGQVEVVLVVQPKRQNGFFTIDAASAEPATTQKADLTARIENGVHQSQDERLRQARFARILELLDKAFAGVEWAEIEEGRQDRDD
jgi:hypothetical protein